MERRLNVRETLNNCCEIKRKEQKAFENMHVVLCVYIPFTESFFEALSCCCQINIRRIKKIYDNDDEGDGKKHKKSREGNVLKMNIFHKRKSQHQEKKLFNLRGWGAAVGWVMR